MGTFATQPSKVRMTIEALIVGKLHERAQARTSSNTGRQFVTAKVRAGVAEGESVFVNVVAFSESAGAALQALEAGDSVALAGTLKPGAWIDREGNARPSLDLVAAQVMTVYGLTKKRKASTEAQDRHAAPPAPAARPRAPAAGDELDAGDDDAWLRGEA